MIRLEYSEGLWVASLVWPGRDNAPLVAAQGGAPDEALARLGRSIVAQWYIERGSPACNPVTRLDLTHPELASSIGRWIAL